MEAKTAMDPCRRRQNKDRDVFLVLLACFQNALVGGIIYGWPSLQASNILLSSSGDCGVGLDHGEAVAL